MLRHLLASLLIVALSVPAAARPAAWYWWVSQGSDARICWQTSPGQAWIKEAQPFRDARCSIRM